MNVSDNRLLGSLPTEARERLEGRLEAVDLKARATLNSATLYFPASGLISIVTAMEDGTMVEAALVGREGVVGLPFISPKNRAQQLLVRAPGEAWALPGSYLRANEATEPELILMLARYAELLFNLAAQSAACKCHHSASQRLARWLLLVTDRLGQDHLPITHESLAQTLGLHRPTVSVAAMALRHLGCISYSRGDVVICERQKLEEQACECYWTMRALDAALFD